MVVLQHTIAMPTELIIDTIFGQYLRLRVMRLILNIIVVA